MIDRPRVDDSIRRAAAARCASELISEGHFNEGDRGQVIADLCKVTAPQMDGYKVARALEDRCGWSPRFEMLEALDCLSLHCEDELRQAEQAWVEANDIEPPLAVGTEVVMPDGEGLGIITDIGGKQYPACYLVKPVGQDDEKEHHRRWIVKFEQAEAA